MPGNTAATEALARIARRQSRWRDSLRLFEQAAKLNPRDPRLFMDRAWTLSVLREYRATEEMIDQALTITPDDPDVLVNKAYLYQTTGKLPAARAVIERIPTSVEREAVRNVRILQLTLERRYEEAVRLQEEKLARTDRPPSERGGDREWLGWLRSLAGDQQGARDAYLDAQATLGTSSAAATAEHLRCR